MSHLNHLYCCFVLNILLMVGLISFQIYRSPDGAKAFAVVRDIMKALVSGSIQFERKFIDAAKSSVVFTLISNEVYLLSTWFC